jgi:hypothetical protein
MRNRAKEQILQQRLADRRSKQVVFLAHCLLNENTRYLGRACQRGCVREIVEQCVAGDLGMVQMPCPEQQAWGGVLKHRLLAIYGTQGTWWYHGWAVLLPLLLAYIRWVYGRLARQVAAQIADYQDAGFIVRAVVGIGGSPSCGVWQTLDLPCGLTILAHLDMAALTVERMNARIRQSQTPGRGLFIAALRRELARRRIAVPFLAHDLLAELAGEHSTVRFTRL